MLSVEKLREYGANVDEGMARCMNNETFYLRLVNIAVEDAGFEKLCKAVEKGDQKESFEAAHALKGMLSNLSLTPMSAPVSEMTELLRAGKEADYQAFWEQIREQREKLRALRDEA